MEGETRKVVMMDTPDYSILRSKGKARMASTFHFMLRSQPGWEVNLMSTLAMRQSKATG